MEIRVLKDDDWSQVMPIVSEVVRAGDTFTYDPAMGEDGLRVVWAEPPPGQTVVAVEGGQVFGTARMGPNRQGPGAHVATASYMVAASARGRGVGESLVRFTLAWARDCGFAGMQFNAVAASNESAVELYERLGFAIVGTVPGAFAHPVLGRVGLHVMYCPLDDGNA